MRKSFKNRYLKISGLIPGIGKCHPEIPGLQTLIVMNFIHYLAVKNHGFAVKNADLDVIIYLFMICCVSIKKNNNNSCFPNFFKVCHHGNSWLPMMSYLYLKLPMMSYLYCNYFFNGNNL